MGEFFPPPPLFLSPLLSFFFLSLTYHIIFDFSDFIYIITKIHPPFQNPGSAPAPIVWNMCENLHYESVYFKELRNQQEYY